MTNIESILKKKKKQRHYFVYKASSSQSFGFFSSHVWMWKLDHKGSWVLKNWCFWTVVLEMLLRLWRVPWTARRSNQLGNQSWIFIGRTDAEAETPILWLRCEELTHWKIPWSWKILKVGGEGDNRGWDGWMASLTKWTWVWVNSRSWWWTGKPGMLLSMESERIGHN